MNDYFSRNRLLILLVFLVIALPYAILAGTTGRIIGTVLDKDSNAPLPFANIVVEGLEIGVMADETGQFRINGVPGGEVTLIVTMMGYQNLRLEGLMVTPDLTASVTLELVTQAQEVVKEVVVTASRPLLQKDLTATMEVVTAEDINRQAATSIGEVLVNLPGMVSSGGLHLRGGRGTEILYLLDGLSVQNPIVGDVATRINPNSLAELIVITSGNNAEYGEALSGVINTVRKEGGSKLEGSFSFYNGSMEQFIITDSIINDKNGTFDEFASLVNSFDFSLGGPLLPNSEKLKFFIAGEYHNDAGYLPRDKYTYYNGDLNLTYKPLTGFKLNLFGHYYFNDRELYEHRDNNDYSYDFNLDGLSRIQRYDYNFGVRAKHAFSDNGFYELSIGQQHQYYLRAPDIKNLNGESLFDLHWKDWDSLYYSYTAYDTTEDEQGNIIITPSDSVMVGYKEDANGNYNGNIHNYNYRVGQTFRDEYGGIRFTEGNDFFPLRRERIADIFQLKFDLEHAFLRTHTFKTGFEVNSYKLSLDDKSFFNENPYGEIWEESPYKFALYGQSTFEWPGFVLNAGLRFDYHNANTEYWYDPILKATAEIPSDFEAGSAPGKVKTKPTWQLSPRIGIAHPITEVSKLFFNYGHYFQIPEYYFFFENSQAAFDNSYPRMGNPALDAQRNVLYEVGYEQLVTSDIKFSVRGFYKDMFEILAMKEVVYPGGKYTIYDNIDWGSSKGLELTLEKKPVDRFSGSVNYTFQIAQGSGSDPQEFYYDYYTEGENAPVYPKREYPLDFDQRHTLSAILAYQIPSGPGVSVNMRYGSGLPYTRRSISGERIGNINDGRMPYSFTSDLKLYQAFSTGKFTHSFFVQVENLFDKRNILNVYDVTGRPDFDGQDFTGRDDTYRALYRFYAYDPLNYSAPREIRLGYELSF